MARGKIKNYRIEQGLSIKKLAKQIGVEEKTLVSWERNDASPQSGKYLKIKELINQLLFILIQAPVQLALCLSNLGTPINSS